MRLLRAIEEEHAAKDSRCRRSRPWWVVPEATAQRAGLRPRHDGCGDAAGWLEDQNAIEGDRRAGEVGGKRMYLITARGVEMLGKGP